MADDLKIFFGIDCNKNFLNQTSVINENLIKFVESINNIPWIQPANDIFDFPTQNSEGVTVTDSEIFEQLIQQGDKIKPSIANRKVLIENLYSNVPHVTYDTEGMASDNVGNSNWPDPESDFTSKDLQSRIPFSNAHVNNYTSVIQYYKDTNKILISLGKENERNIGSENIKATKTLQSPKYTFDKDFKITNSTLFNVIKSVFYSPDNPITANVNRLPQSLILSWSAVPYTHSNVKKDKKKHINFYLTINNAKIRIKYWIDCPKYGKSPQMKILDYPLFNDDNNITINYLKLGHSVETKVMFDPNFTVELNRVQVPNAPNTYGYLPSEQILTIEQQMMDWIKNNTTAESLKSSFYRVAINEPSDVNEAILDSKASFNFIISDRIRNIRKNISRILQEADPQFIAENKEKSIHVCIEAISCLNTENTNASISDNRIFPINNSNFSNGDLIYFTTIDPSLNNIDIETAYYVNNWDGVSFKLESRYPGRDNFESQIVEISNNEEDNGKLLVIGPTIIKTNNPESGPMMVTNSYLLDNEKEILESGVLLTTGTYTSGK